MRVITGSAKGRKLKMPKGGKTRPAMDKVKGSTFNIIAPLIHDSKFLDLFAGSGNLGIEALSRGADYAVFVDASRECTRTIKENLELTRLSDNAKVFTMDCLKFLKNKNFEFLFDVVFIDPPYLKGLLDPLLKFIPCCSFFNQTTLFIIERQKKDELPILENPEFIQTDERNFGDTVLTFFKLR
jgi:16S rRNA (guanine(966)-N(2))-methyltransferase RsmD